MAKLAHTPLPSFELLQELLYVSETSPSGLRWRNPRANCLKPDQVAGFKRVDGYWYVRVKTDISKQYLTHRIVYLLQTGEDPKDLQVDHVFGKHDQLSLRLATNADNTANSKKILTVAGKECSSKFKGVSWHKGAQKWQAYVTLQGKRSYLGLFINETEAAIVYNEAALEYHGKFAKLNKID